MKKAFLFLSILGVFCVTNVYAVQSQVVVVYTCPAGCEVVQSSTGTEQAGIEESECVKVMNGVIIRSCGDPTVTILDTSANPALQSEITAQLQKQTKENVVKKRQKVSSINRAAKKLIYKEVVFDEPIVLTDKDLEDFEM